MGTTNRGEAVISPEIILKMAGENRSIDRSELGIDTPKTFDGLQVLNDGLNFFCRKEKK